jgi:hypothetical protein
MAADDGTGGGVEFYEIEDGDQGDQSYQDKGQMKIRDGRVGG